MSNSFRFISPVVGLLVALCLQSAMCFAEPTGAPRSSSLMAISADGTILACSNRDSGTVSIVDLKTNTKLREIDVGGHEVKPEGIAFLGDSHRLAVALYLADKVVFLDADSGAALGYTDVFDEPYGVVSSAKGDKVYVTLSYPGQVIEIDTATRKVGRTFAAGPFARGLAISADDSRLYVTEYYTSNVLAIDTATGDTVDRWNGIASDNLSRQITLHPTRPKAYLSHIRSAVERAHGEGSIFPYVTIVDTTKGEGRRRKRMPMDSFTGVHVTANPWEVAITPDGKRFFSVFSGTNDLYACDVVDDDYREISYRTTLQLGNNPRAVRVSNDSKTFYVYNALDFNIVAYDVNNLRKVATIEVTANPLSEEMLLGKRLFYTALAPMASRRWIACSSCHVDGESDMRTWQNPEGLRNTPPLMDMAWTHPLHWSADRDEVQDFEHTIRGNLMQGRGLIKSKVKSDLGEANKGLSAELDALAAYSNSHKTPLSPHAKNGLNDAGKRGKEIFFSKQTNCASCHGGPYFCDSKPSPVGTVIDKFTRHDVGTGPPHNGDPSEKMGPKYDTPTLLGIYKSGPYLHDGKAATLEDVLTTHNRGDRHGTTSHLTKPQVADLVEFLKALPYEDVEPKAKELGMMKIER